MEENKIKINFSYTDEFGQETNLNKSYDDAVLMDNTSFDFLVEQFKCFLYATGFSKRLVDKIQIVEDEEQ